MWIKLNQVSVIQAMQKTDPDRYKSEVKTIQNKMKIANPGDILRVIKNIENKYPNGLYVKEARAILRKQQEYYPELISNAFIEVCISIIQARIPLLHRTIINGRQTCMAGKKG